MTDVEKKWGRKERRMTRGRDAKALLFFGHSLSPPFFQLMETHGNSWSKNVIEGSCVRKRKIITKYDIPNEVVVFWLTFCENLRDI